jgi:hypothetical protein
MRVVEMNVAIMPMSKCEMDGDEPPMRRRWTLEEYYRLADAGFLQDQRVELVDGDILMSPMGPRHANAVILVAERLRIVFGDSCLVCQQLPLRVTPQIELAPDVMILRRTIDQLEDSPISTAELVVEVADSSLNYDLRVKPNLYALARVAEYWVLDLKGRQLHAHREPSPDPSQTLGFAYKSLLIIDEKQSIAPLGAPSGAVAVAHLLP